VEAFEKHGEMKKDSNEIFHGHDCDVEFRAILRNPRAPEYNIHLMQFPAWPPQAADKKSKARGE
jgi:hypothetical protein